MDNDDDEFYDTYSLMSYSSLPKRRSYCKDYISVSRNTVYHSALGLDMEMENIGEPRNPHKKVAKYPVSYSQWRDRVLYVLCAL